jgi:hypothetical protein
VIDEEVKLLIDKMYQRVHTLLKENFDMVTSVGNLLLEKETISHDDVIELVGARPFAMDANYAEYISQKESTSDDTLVAESIAMALDDVESEAAAEKVETVALDADAEVEK